MRKRSVRLDDDERALASAEAHPHFVACGARQAVQLRGSSHAAHAGVRAYARVGALPVEGHGRLVHERKLVPDAVEGSNPIVPGGLVWLGGLVGLVGSFGA